MRSLLIILCLAAGGSLLWSGAMSPPALAADSLPDPSQPPPPTPSADLEGDPVPATEPGIDSVRDVVVAAKAGRWRAVIALGLIFLVWGSRKLLSNSAKMASYLHQDLWGTVYAFLVAALSFLGTALGTDVAIDGKLLSAAGTAGLLAVGGYSVLWKKVLKPLVARVMPGSHKPPETPPAVV